jgi:tRNA dimethylallyltransferase
MPKRKIVVILGPTASGKTSLAVKLAASFNGEIVSADSRQVYRGMDVGTGKDLKEYGDILYHLIDVAEPNEVFDLAQYQRLAFKAIDDILKRGKLPIVVGGSGLYLQALVDGYQLPAALPDAKLRAELEKKSLAELQHLLTKQNKGFFDKLNNSDKNNKRRLIRYIEITQNAKLKTQSQNAKLKTLKSPYSFLLIGLKWPQEVLAERITKRLKERLAKEGMIEEVQQLHREGVSFERLESFGLEYKFIAQYLQDKLDYDEMFALLNTAIRQFAKRQLTWFKRWEKQGRKINWLNNAAPAAARVKKFLK